MKVTLPPRRWIILGGTLAATLGASVWPRSEDNAAPDVVAPIIQRKAQASKEQPTTREPPQLRARPERSFALPAQDLFGVTDWNPPPPPPARIRETPPPPAPPTVPPFPYTVAGTLTDANGLMIVFSGPERNVILRPGEVLDETYRVEVIEPQSVTLTYLPLGLTLVLSRQAVN